MDFEALNSQLAQNPNDWAARTTIVQSYYESGQYPEAANLLSAAPEIPSDEESVIFSAMVLGAVNPDSGHQLLDQKMAQGSTPGLTEAKAQLFDMQGDAASAAATRGSSMPPVVAAPVAAIPPPAAVPTPQTLAPPTEAGSAPLPSAPAVFTPPPTTEAALSTISPVEGDGPALFVAEGQAVQGVEAEPDTGSKFGAIMIAIVAHIVIVLLLMLAKSAVPKSPPPQMTASAVGTSEDSLDNKTMTKATKKTAAAVSTSTPVIASQNFSSVSLPEMSEMTTDFSMTSMSQSDSGFAMSMSGFGDVSNMGSIPAAMRSRCSMGERMKRLRESGGEERAERAVRNGLDFISSQQNPKDGAFGKEYTAAATGLALLAYLGHCETPESPKYGNSVVKAAVYLMDRAKARGANGVITNGKEGHHEAYEHAIATYALCELFTMTKESGQEIPGLRNVLRKAVGVIVEGQDPLGGWSYLRGGTEDMSVTGWNIQALKAAYNTGEKFTGVDRTLDKSVQKYLPKIQDGKGAFKYRPENPDGKATLTGAALLGMQIWDEMGSGSYNKGLAYLNKAYPNPTPSAGGHGLYDEYYNTQVYFLHGGKDWERYNKAFQPKLLNAQQKDGSWKIGGGKGVDGPLINSAWAVLMLEVYYRYLPTTDKLGDLKKR